MSRLALAILSIICLISALGCGGGSGGGNDNVSVNIQGSSGSNTPVGRFYPKNVTIQPGDKVTWFNTDTVAHQVVSGTLTPQGNPLVVYTITIGITGFSPAFLQANLGDTIRFNNLTGSTFEMVIVNDNGQVVSDVTLAQGELRTITFPGAGAYLFRQAGSQLNVGQIVLYGQPTPDNQFESPVLSPGQTFTRQFNTTGTFNYFDLNQNNPNQSFMTGTISVQ